MSFLNLGARDSYVKEIDNALQSARSVVRESRTTVQVAGQPFVVWPLFLGEKAAVPPSEIDGCATPVGAATLLQLMEGDCSPQMQAILQNAIKTILFTRNPDGSWPSFIQLSTSQPPKMEGILNDTTYSLEALLELGFLDHAPRFPMDTSLDERIDIILESVKWLLDNRVGEGWHYTGIEYLENAEAVSPSVLPTSNVIVVLHKVITALDRLGRSYELAAEMKEAYNEAINWLQDVQSGGGFGKKRGDRPTIVHTAIAIRALLTDKSEGSSNKALDGLRWILRRNNASSIQKPSRVDIFDEYDQIIFMGDSELRKRMISHENFLEGLVLNILIETDRAGFTRRLGLYERYRYRKTTLCLLEELIKRQCKAGPLQGAFECRRGTPAQNYPIYALYFAVLALKSLRSNMDSVLSNPSRQKLLLLPLSFVAIAVVATASLSWAFGLPLEKAAGVLIAETVFGICSTVITGWFITG